MKTITATIDIYEIKRKGPSVMVFMGIEPDYEVDGLIRLSIVGKTYCVDADDLLEAVTRVRAFKTKGTK